MQTKQIYSVENVKIRKGRGMEGNGLSANLLLNGKVIGKCEDYGNGGPITVLFKAGESGQQFYAWCRAKPPCVTEYGTFDMEPDLWLGLAVEEAFNN
jgi:hypothetical protein